MTNAQDGNGSGIAPTSELTPARPSTAGSPPGSPAAAEQGCRCSVLANATYRAGVPGVEPLIDPSCHLHLALSAAVSGAVTASIPAVRSTTHRADPAAA